MHLINAVAAARMLSGFGQSNGSNGGEAIPFGSLWWITYAGISCFLVLFAGIMSGLTLGLMSLGLVELEILQRSGTPNEKKQAGDSSSSLIPSFCFRVSQSILHLSNFDLIVILFEIACNYLFACK